MKRYNKICVYTCITGNYDNLKDVNKEKGIDYLCFTNNKNISSNTWQIIYIEDNDLDNITLARKTKIIINDYIKENYDICIWIDGATFIRGSIYDFLDRKCDLDNYDMTVFKHSVRDCVYDEALAIIKYRKENIEKVRNVISFLEEKKYPRHNGLTETTVLVRKTNSKAVNQTMEMWFKLLKTYTIRDQLTFDYAVAENKLILNYLDMNVFDNEWFGWIEHNKRFNFDTCRIYFGDYFDIHDDNIDDVKNCGKGDTIIYSSAVKKDCDFIECHIGQLNNGVISQLNINGDREVLSNCLLSIDGMYLLSDDPLIIRYNKTMKCGDLLEIKFDLNELDLKGYRNLLLKQNTELSRVINNLNETIQSMQNNKKGLLGKLIKK